MMAWAHEWKARELDLGDEVAMSEVVFKSRAMGIEEILFDFEKYLAACGFLLDGVHLDLVENEAAESEGGDPGI